MSNEQGVYQRIGEFTVSFQWIENKLREIGWFILDPGRLKWPPPDLRNITNEKLIDRVHELFLEALPKCKLSQALEADLKDAFSSSVERLHRLRRDRNRMLHSAYVEIKAGGEIEGILRSGARLQVDDETGEPLFDQELLTDKSFTCEMQAMVELELFLDRVYKQLIHRYPNGGA